MATTIVDVDIELKMKNRRMKKLERKYSWSLNLTKRCIIIDG